MPCESTVVYKTLPNMCMDAGFVWGIVVLVTVAFCAGFCCLHRAFPNGILRPYHYPMHPAMFQGYHDPGNHYNNPGSHRPFYPPQHPPQHDTHHQELERKELPVQKFEISYKDGHHPLHPQEHDGVLYHNNQSHSTGTSTYTSRPPDIVQIPPSVVSSSRVVVPYGHPNTFSPYFHR